jgi:hypothetical protein
MWETEKKMLYAAPRQGVTCGLHKGIVLFVVFVAPPLFVCWLDILLGHEDLDPAPSSQVCVLLPQYRWLDIIL